MVDIMTVQALVIIGAILGGVGRQMLPYIRKVAAAEQSGGTVQYQHRYTATAVFSVIVAGIVAMTLFPQLTANIPAGATLPTIFFSSFLMAWGSTDLFASVAATGSGNGTTGTTTAKPATPTTT